MKAIHAQNAAISPCSETALASNATAAVPPADAANRFKHTFSA
jgi:hypothetical protein